MISNELLKKKILDEAIHGRLVENDPSLKPIDVRSINDDIPFEVPNNWRCCCLENIATCKTGNSINEKEKQENFSNMSVDGLYYVATKDISKNSIINYENGIKIPCNLLEKFKIAEKNSILLCIEGGSAGKKIGFTTKNICFVNKLCNISSKVINNKFIYYFMQTVFFYKQFESKKTGIIGGVSIKNIEKIIILVPPLEEQEKIVKKIEELFELIDKKEKNDKEKDKLKTLLKEKTLDSAIHGNLVENDLTLPTIDVEEIKKDVPFDLPSNWKWTIFDQIIDVRDGTHESPKYIEYSDYPLITSKNLTKNGLNFENANYLSKEDYDSINVRSFVDDGDILFAMIGSIGNPVLVNKTRNFAIKNVALFKCSKNVFNKYLLYYLKSQGDMSNKTKGGVQKFVSLKILRNYLIPIPPIEQQKKIVEKIEECFKLIEQL